VQRTFFADGRAFSGSTSYGSEVCELINEIACLDELNTIIVVTHDVTAAATWPITLAHEDGDAR